jgi:putative transcriptional regulator
MKPLHHPSEATLMVFAAGGLSQGMALVVAGHLEHCAFCRDAVAAAEALGGVLLDEIVPEEVSDETRRRVCSRLALERSPTPPPSRPESSACESLEKLLAKRQAVGRWDWLSPGVRHLSVSPELRLLRAEPGRSLPLHDRTGAEMTLVLEGACSDEHDHFCEGDVVELDGTAAQRPLADRSLGCLCLLASNASI